MFSVNQTFDISIYIFIVNICKFKFMYIYDNHFINYYTGVYIL